jgi:GTP cyclohydrolase IA
MPSDPFTVSSALEDTFFGEPDFKKMRDDKEAVEAAEVLLRTSAGLDIEDTHGTETPQRFVNMLRELTTPKDIKWKTFDNDGMDEMIVIEPIPFVSLCSHHVIPFMGAAYIGYIPKDRIAGLSKFARVVHHFSAALQVQERLTKQVADFLEQNLEPAGIAVVMKAEHLCMTIRGVQVPGAKTTTAAMRGRFSDHERTAKMEFLSHINGSHL